MIPKFRAWHIKAKLMCCVCELHFTEMLGMGKNTAGIMRLDMPYGGFFSFDESKPEIILMEFTGILDKNTIEVFEADIVKCPAIEKNAIGVVVRRRSERGASIPGWDIQLKNGGSGLTNYGGEFSPEVIGNIYENPELLDFEEGND